MTIRGDQNRPVWELTPEELIDEVREHGWVPSVLAAMEDSGAFEQTSVDGPPGENRQYNEFDYVGDDPGYKGTTVVHIAPGNGHSDMYLLEERSPSPLPDPGDPADEMVANTMFVTQDGLPDGFHSYLDRTDGIERRDTDGGAVYEFPGGTLTVTGRGNLRVVTRQGAEFEDVDLPRYDLRAMPGLTETTTRLHRAGDIPKPYRPPR
ncbi:MAG: hypothetical protein ABEK12_02360 [Candidatus Nanohaloarchaea archaeon]